jgi:hypothetical protein
MREHPDLELENANPDNPVTWVLQRAGWVGMLLLIVAAIAGIFGTGLFERARIEREGFNVSYSRFQRTTVTKLLEVTVRESRAEVTRIWIDGDYSRRVQIGDITPEPESSTSTGESILYTFRSVPGQPFVVTFQVRVSDGSFGPLSGSVGLEGRGQVDFLQFIWP